MYNVASPGNPSDLRRCAWCPRMWTLHRRLGLHRPTTSQLEMEIEALWRSPQRDQRERAATLAGEIEDRGRRRRDEEARAARLGIPTSLRAVYGDLAGRTIVVGSVLWMLAWLPAWRSGLPGHLVGLLAPPVLPLAVWLRWRRTKQTFAPRRGVVYCHAPGLAAGPWLSDPDLRLRGRPHRVVRGTNGDLVVQAYRQAPSGGQLRPGDAIEGLAHAVLVQRHFGEECSRAEVHFEDACQRIPLGPDAREHLAALLAYMRRLQSGAETAPVRADRACLTCTVRLMCAEGRQAAAEAR